MTSLRAFATREAAADACADALAGALPERGPATLVVTGGSSPGPVYDDLASRDLDWRRVTVTLSDDRWVDLGSSDSNERLVRERLLTERAAEARLVGLVRSAADPTANAAAVEAEIARLLPSAAVLLGMGEDGHIASLFPADPDLPARLDPDAERLVVGAEAGLAPFVPRISLTVHALLQTGLVVLLITGGAKRALVERVLAEPDYHPPVAAVLRQDRAPVRILWAP
jgi:6-phosphogluconolactonase